MTYTYKIIQFKNEPYSVNNEHHDSVALTDAQHEIKWLKTYNETLKTILHYNLYTIICKQAIIGSDISFNISFNELAKWNNASLVSQICFKPTLDYLKTSDLMKVSL